MVRIFREGPGPNALALAMTAVRLGERQLLVGDDGALFAELALKAGLTGHVSVPVGSEGAAARMRAAAGDAGAVMAVEQVTLPALQVGAGEFDVAVIQAGPTLLTALDAEGRTALARAVLEALRPGARAVVVERPTRSMFGLVRTQPAGLAAFRAGGGATALLEAAGFRPIRLLADREGERYTEGLKPLAGR